MEQRLAELALDSLRSRITEILPAQIRACVEQLDEEQLWWRPNEGSNSVGNLVLHVSGSLRHYLCRSLGGFEYDRDRSGEFAERGPLSKNELIATFDEMVSQAKATLDVFDTSRFTASTEEPSYYPFIFDQLIGVLTHLSAHTGQIIFVAKLMKEGAVDEIWIRAHKLNR
ncbi:MAG: hypothetical protein DMF61_02730 [Blastocatellia bacterium AA13]|nr:MAG: hypothetical protein DMF61_02730 [Blastocatellia bacterium AA13]